MKTLLVDGDMFAFWLAFGQKRLLGRATERVQLWRERLRADRAVICLGCPREEIWRRQHYPPYKTNPRSEKPAAHDEAMRVIRENFITRAFPNCEADDVCGALSTCPLIEGEKVIVGDDKDFATVPATRYSPTTGLVVEQSARAARYAHAMQTLTGDEGDGYPGIKGVGPAKAKKILGSDDSSWWLNTCNAFERAGMTVSDAIAQARCAKILTWDLWDSKNRRVIPWTPPYGVLAEAMA